MSYVPEHYGPGFWELALAILDRQPTPPAVYISHELVTATSIHSGAHDWLTPDRNADQVRVGSAPGGSETAAN